MLSKKSYSNGQKVYDLKGNRLTFYYKNGKIKAEGIFENNMMEGEWKFYRETEQLWQIGNFTNNMKNGSWIRYDRNNQAEYNEAFINNKIVKKNS